MKTELLRTISFVRNFLFSLVNKEFLIFLFFLVLSGAFWLSMTLDESYEKEVAIPIKVVNIPKNAVVTTEIEDTIRVTIRDKGFAFLSYLYGDGIRPIAINFASYANKNTGKGNVPIADVQKMVYQRLSGASRITGIKPDRLDFYFNFGLSKRVPVRISGNILPAKNYYLASTNITPGMVTVYANKNMLDSVRYISTEELNITNFEDTVVRKVHLKKIRGVKAVPSTVRIRLSPDILTEESYDVPITVINMPQGKVLRTFPRSVMVKFNVGASAFRQIKFSEFSVLTNYKDLEEHPSDKCTLYLNSVPYGVRNARLAVTKVDYLIEQQ